MRARTASGVASERLAAAADAAAGAGHHLDEVQVAAARLDLLEQLAGVAQAADDGDAELGPAGRRTVRSCTPSGRADLGRP